MRKKLKKFREWFEWYGLYKEKVQALKKVLKIYLALSSLCFSIIVSYARDLFHSHPRSSYKIPMEIKPSEYETMAIFQ